MTEKVLDWLQCIHYWHIDQHNIGTCIKCGAVEDFDALQEICRKELVPPGNSNGVRSSDCRCLS